jgi:hypothetical protein
MEANPQRLIRLWRDFGIRSPQQVATTLQELADCDLIRLYEAENKQFLHIPRFRQNLRYVKRVHPLSPWTTDKQKQQVAKDSPSDSMVGTPLSPGSHGRSEVKGSDMRSREETPTPLSVNDSKKPSAVDIARGLARKHASYPH